MWTQSLQRNFSVAAHSLLGVLGSLAHADDVRLAGMPRVSRTARGTERAAGPRMRSRALVPVPSDPPPTSTSPVYQRALLPRLTTDEICALLRQAGDAAHSVPVEDLPRVLAHVEYVRAKCNVGLHRPPQPALPPAPVTAASDRLLKPSEAAEKLGLTMDYLYRHADTFPFTVRPSPKQLRFSARGIEEWIRKERARR